VNDETETPPTGEPAGAGDPGGPDPELRIPEHPVGGEPTTGPTPPPVEDTSPKPLAVEEAGHRRVLARAGGPAGGRPGGRRPAGRRPAGRRVGGRPGRTAGREPEGGPHPDGASPPPPEAPASARRPPGEGRGWTVPPARFGGYAAPPSGAHPVGGDRHGPGGPRGPWQFLLGALIGAVRRRPRRRRHRGRHPRRLVEPQPERPPGRNTSVFAEPKDVQASCRRSSPRS